jgi:hypothetical protein
MRTLHIRFFMVPLLVALVVGSGTSREDNQASIKIDSQPAGTEVVLGKINLGKTPLSWNATHFGLQPLVLKKDGYATLNLQVYLEKGAPLDLGQVPLAKSGSVLTIWRVGSPHNAGVPAAEIPKDLDVYIKNLGFETKVTALSAKDFPPDFRAAARKGDLPDIICGNNYSPFQDVMEDKNLKARLMNASGVTHMLDDFVFLVSGSANHPAARYLALVTKGRSVRFSWTLDEVDYGQRPGQLKSQADRKSLEDLNFQAMTAYLANDLKKLSSLAHEETLSKEGAFGWAAHHVRVVGMKTNYILGNSRLAFILAKGSYWADELIGCTEILSVWIKQDRWKLLVISNDPVTVEMATKDIPSISLTEDKEVKLAPAQLLTPDGIYPPPLPGQRFGDFFWAPSASADILAEMAEFNYGQASRLFYQPDAKVSTGQLWTTRRPWSWKVWSIGKNGQVIFSKVNSFRDSQPKARPGA